MKVIFVTQFNTAEAPIKHSAHVNKSLLAVVYFCATYEWLG